MNTPICDFVRSYAEKETVRLHMPGHKGVSLTGFEKHDITEINGADSLYEAGGIIKESEFNAGRLFGASTFYSTEGSSLSIRAMLYLACLCAEPKGAKPLILAGRNAHKVFVSTAALLDFEVEWLYPESNSSYLSCKVTSEEVDKKLCTLKRKPIAVYLTSPDYLGNEVDIKSIADVCHKHGVLLLVDNAHGAYLKFLPESRHPIDLGADACSDSAHKTLPVLTGGAYLHISKSAPEVFKERAKDALALFGSTSPSYLILQSLDMANKYISEGYISELAGFVRKVSELKARLKENGFVLYGNEELKITIMTKPYGYNGNDFADILEGNGVVCEFSDLDFVVMMLTPQIKDKISLISDILVSVPKKEPIDSGTPKLSTPERVIGIREAYFSKSTVVNVDSTEGRILANASVGCPPAVPIVVSGERISREAIECFKYYGVEACTVVE